LKSFRLRSSLLAAAQLGRYAAESSMRTQSKDYLSTAKIELFSGFARAVSEGCLRIGLSFIVVFRQFTNLIGGHQRD
jgi:hypothetical protein